MKQKDIDFFRPVWRRVAVTLFCCCWALFEWYSDEPFWGMIAIGMVGYCYWNFFHAYEGETETEPDKTGKE